MCKPSTRSVHSEKPTEKVMEVTPDTTPTFSLDYLAGHFDPAEHPDFVEIDTTHADKPRLYLREDVYRAFREMYAAALGDSVHLQIRSATRNFDDQKGIWERKWTGETRIEGGKEAPLAYPDPVERARAIMKYSSMPGTSRHHWGTDIDLNAFDNSWFASGKGLKVYAWLTANAGTYGFCQPYTKKDAARPHGYEEEKWHWTYVPVAEQLTRLAEDSLQAETIMGFMGAEVAGELQVIERYVLGIAGECRK